MMLGDVLAMARQSAPGMVRWLESSSPEMHGRVRATAAAAGLTATGFVRMAVADFTRAASEEDWATLMSALRNSADPGQTCLHAMIHWRLSAPDCGAHV
ncbi:hypothetical protein WBP06_09645 [Novosphingobium sp. BL-8H]|uniref:hypothetical protein n=1 Tax=Novosphingobium sp. BL-8H TaxID=3127640 RepID=UPI003757F11D